MRAIGYFRLRDKSSTLSQLGERFAEYCEKYLNQAITTFGDDVSGQEISDDVPHLPEYRKLLAYLKESDEILALGRKGASMVVKLGDSGERRRAKLPAVLASPNSAVVTGDYLAAVELSGAVRYLSR